MLKKRHIFYIIYVLVMLCCMTAALILNPMYRTPVPELNNNDLIFGAFHTVAGDVMLIITAILLAVAILFLIIRKIYISIHIVNDKNRKK